METLTSFRTTKPKNSEMVFIDTFGIHNLCSTFHVYRNGKIFIHPLRCKMNKQVAERLNRKFVVDALQQQYGNVHLNQGPVQIEFTFPSLMVTR